jgi:MFS family permease
MRLSAPYDRMLAPVYVPSFLMAISQQALLILMPLYVLQLGGSPALAALVAGLRGLGVLAFDVPAGMLVARFGDKPVLLGGLTAVLVGMLVLALSADPWMVAWSAVPLGIGSAAWMLGRQSYVTDASAPEELGRTIAVMAGLQRVGAFIGPAAGGVVAAHFSYPAAFLAGAVSVILAGGLVLVYTRHIPPKRDQDDFGIAGTARVIRSQGRVFATAGVGAFVMQLMRATRQLLVPLFGEAIGLNAATIGAVYSISAAVDMSLFYPVGVVVDRWGRKWISVPAMTVFACGFVALPFAHDFYSLLFAGLVLGLANGISTGIVMIMGSDLAPGSQRGQFLGMWRLFGDLGMSAGPLLAGVLVDVATLGAASAVVAGAGFAGALIVLLWVPETLRQAGRDAGDNASSGTVREDRKGTAVP